MTNEIVTLLSVLVIKMR